MSALSKWVSRLTGPAKGVLSPLVGVDCGHWSTKVVRVVPEKKVFRVAQAFSERTESQWEQRVGDQVVARGMKRMSSAFSIGDESVETHQSTFPKLPADELETAIQWELKKALPSPEFVFYDTLRFERPTGVEVDFVVVPKDMIQALHGRGSVLNLTPAYCETESAALQVCLEAVLGEVPDRVAILDLGYSACRLVFCHAGRVVLTRSLYFGIESLAGEAQLDPATVSGSEQRVQEGLYNLCEEFRRSEFFAREKKGVPDVERLYLCGGGATLSPVVHYLKEQLSDKRLELLNPFQAAAGLPEGVSLEQGPVYAVAVGLALREGE